MVRKNKNQSRLKKILTEREREREREMQKPKSTEENTERVQKPLWLEINRKEFEELTGDIYNNQGNNDFKIIIKKTYDLKDAKKNLDGSNYT